MGSHAHTSNKRKRMTIKVKKIPNLVSNRTSTDPDQHMAQEYFRQQNQPRILQKTAQNPMLYENALQLQQQYINDSFDVNLKQVQTHLQSYQQLRPVKLDTTPYQGNPMPLYS